MHKTEICLRTADFYCVRGTHMYEFSMRTEQNIVRTYAVHIVIYFAGKLNNLEVFNNDKSLGFCLRKQRHTIIVNPRLGSTCMLLISATKNA